MRHDNRNVRDDNLGRHCSCMGSGAGELTLAPSDNGYFTV